jgi:hypothetical protein
MANIRIAMINANTVLTDDQVQAAVPAMQTQVHRDFAPPWEINAGQNFVPSGASPDPRLRCLRACQDQAGALGYHDVTDQGFLATWVRSLDAARAADRSQFSDGRLPETLH